MTLISAEAMRLIVADLDWMIDEQGKQVAEYRALLELNRLEALASKRRPPNGTPRPIYTWTLKAAAAAARRYRLAVRELTEARIKR